MIEMDRADLTSQAGMERAFARYFMQVREDAQGFNAMLDPRLLSCDYENRTLTLLVETREWMKNPGGILHGGIIASLLDFVMGLLCRYFSGGTMTPTVSMTVDFLRSAPVGGNICIRAELTKRGRTICAATGSMWARDRADRLLATASGTYFVSGGGENHVG